jgi:hypothetical protein
MKPTRIELTDTKLAALRQAVDHHLDELRRVLGAVEFDACREHRLFCDLHALSLELGKILRPSPDVAHAGPPKRRGGRLFRILRTMLVLR